MVLTKKINLDLISRFSDSVKNFFLPRFCPTCNKVVSKELLCNECYILLNTVKYEDRHLDFLITFSKSKFIEDMFYLFKFTKDSFVQTIIHEIKYNNKYLLGYYLGEKLGKELMRQLPVSEINYILPIPIHRLRKADRGYNQAFYIAKGVSKTTGIPLLNNILIKAKYTDTQTHYSLRQRKINIINSFEITKHIAQINNKSVLLIDDVVTTGSTIIECAKMLYLNRVNKVFVASLCKATLHS